MFLRTFFIHLARTRVEPRSVNVFTGPVRLFSGGFEEAVQAKKKKKAPEIRINLFNKKKEMTVTTLEDAEKMAKRRGLVLVQAVNAPRYMTVGDRPAYELREQSEILDRSEESKYKNAGFKGVKHVQLTTRTTDHDLTIKLKKVNKWLVDGYVAEIFITCPKSELNPEVTIAGIESKLIGAKIPGVVKSKSKSSMKLLYEPAKESTEGVSGGVENQS